MKKHLFFFAMLAGVTTSAQVTNVAPVSANYAAKTVSFRVWWNAGSRDATHLFKVWVWVDYITVNSNNTISGNTWTRATVGTISGGTTAFDDSNRKGFWLEGNATTNYSATLTVQLTNVPNKFNWCAYVSDYPPNVTANNGTYTFKGTPPFRLIAADGTTTQTVSGKTLTTSDLTITPTIIRDKTECPGVFCIYNGSDLYIDATHLCQQRTSGAQNWETWIKDTRDNELYRIVQMPDNKWWLAQNVKFAQTGSQLSYCTKDECGRWYTGTQAQGSWGGSSGTGSNKQGACPSGWVIPMWSTYTTLFSTISSDETTLLRRLQANDSPCSGGNDYYGWAGKRMADGGGYPYVWSGEKWRCNDAVGTVAVWNDTPDATWFDCNNHFKGNDQSGASLRCFRP